MPEVPVPSNAPQAPQVPWEELSGAMGLVPITISDPRFRAQRKAAQLPSSRCKVDQMARARKETPGAVRSRTVQLVLRTESYQV